MELEENWNVDDHRQDHESEEHWMLRREFMVQNKDRFPRIKVICLSQVFANVEFLGCKYPAETMELVAELSQGIVEEYRKKQSTRLQRTFVKASTAAEKKSKGDRSSPESDCEVQTPSVETITKATAALPLSRFFVSSSKSGTQVCQTLQTTKTKQVGSLQDNPFYTLGLKKPYKQSIAHTSEQSTSKGITRLGLGYSEDQATITGTNSKLRVSGGLLKNQVMESLRDLVLVEHLYVVDTAIQILNRSCSMSHKSCVMKALPFQKNRFAYSCTIGDKFTVQAAGPTDTDARSNVAELALKKLRSFCYTIQMKEPLTEGTSIGKKDILGARNSPASLEENNIGNRMMRLMGWKGGALGKNEDGVKETIDVSQSVGRGRLGFGSSSMPFNSAQITHFIKEQMNLPGKDDVIFSPEFTAAEREVIHRAANNLGLKSRSYGKNEKRCLVVSRKLSISQLVEDILKSGETPKYRVIHPGEHETLLS